MKKSAIVQYVEKEIKEYLTQIKKDFPESDIDEPEYDFDFLLDTLYQKPWGLDELITCQEDNNCWDELNDAVQFYIETANPCQSLGL